MKKEKGGIRKKKKGRLSFALVYPNLYHVGMSSLGFQLVYSILNRRDEVVAERFFLPEEGEKLRSVESNLPLDKFHVIAFSISFENDYINVLKILNLGGIPLFSKERQNVPPLVIAGGITTFLNPEPLSPFIDFFILGEAEKCLDNVVDLLIDSLGKFSKKEDLLLFLAKNEESIYVPSFYDVEYNADGTIRSFYPNKKDLPERIKVAKDVPLRSVASSVIISHDTEFSDRILIELSRGCKRSCRFCAAGYVYRPPRFHNSSDLLNSIEESLKKTDNLGLLSASVCDVPNIKEILGFICEKGAKFSISSIRADFVDLEFLSYLKKSGQKKVTLGIEAGSERLRSLINKHLKEDQIINTAILVAKAELSIKLYFMIGLPKEEWQDIEEILRLIKLIKHNMIRESAPKGKVSGIRINISCFVPKPFTPFQWTAMDEVDSLKKKQKWLSKEIRKLGGIRVSFDVPKWAYIQALLSLGDRRVGNLLFLAFSFDGNWKKALKNSDINPDFFVYRNRSYDEILPWDFINHGIKKDYLKKEADLAFSYKQTEICPLIKGCKKCGVCYLFEY